MPLLRDMQALLAGFYDAPVEHDVHDYLITDAAPGGGTAGSRRRHRRPTSNC